MDAIVRQWSRLPILLRAAAQGSFVNGVGTAPWVVLSAINLDLWPLVPWSVPVAGAYLWLYWQYLRGRWWPQATAEGRRRSLRAHPLSARLWQWSLAAGILGWIVVLTSRIFFDTLFEVPAEKPAPHAPITILWYILTTSTVAGVAEEAGFRGYMQRPIERRHGPVVAILVVGTMFWLAHLASFIGHWWWFLGYAWYYLFAAAVFGVLAYLTDSILPSIVVHTVANLLGFSVLLWWGSPYGPAAHGSAPRGPVLWTTGALALVFAFASIWAYGRLAREVRSKAGPPS